MPARERLIEIGTRRGERLVREFAEEVRQARLLTGLSQRDVARALGTSTSTLSRIENARPPHADIVTAARLARVLGLDLSLKCFPAGSPLRDAAHVKLVGRFLDQIHASIGRRLEAPIPLDHDQRAWDVLLNVGQMTVGVAAETRLRDLQALIRREQAKQRDSAVDRLLIVLADTQANRLVLREAHAVVRQALPMGTRAAMGSLRRGELPGADALVVLRLLAQPAQSAVGMAGPRSQDATSCAKSTRHGSSASTMSIQDG